jgi:hypothetical protein
MVFYLTAKRFVHKRTVFAGAWHSKPFYERTFCGSPRTPMKLPRVAIHRKHILKFLMKKRKKKKRAA